MSLSPCHSRRELPGETRRFFCAHPKVGTKGHIVGRAFCKICNLWKEPPPKRFRPFRPPPFFQHVGPCFYLGPQTGSRECAGCNGSVTLKVFDCTHPLHTETTHGECQHCEDYVPQLHKGSVTSWCVGVLHTSSSKIILQRCLDELARARWDDVHVFASKGADLEDMSTAKQRSRLANDLGAWGCWYMALSEMYLRTPNANAYFLMHDTIVIRDGARSILEETLWPSGRLSFVSLVPPATRIAAEEIPSLIKAGWDPLGRLEDFVPPTPAMIWPNPSVRSFLSYFSLSPRGQTEDDGWFEVASRIRNWAQDLCLSAHYFFPTLVSERAAGSSVSKGLD